MAEALYKKTILCDQCNTQFDTYKVRSSALRVVSTDSDFCVHYRGVNPNFYDVRVCPNCGNASTEKFSVSFNAATRQIFVETIAKKWKIHDYGGERTWDDALQTYKLALLSAQIRGERAIIIAQICHQIAWLYRAEEDREEEKRFLELALKNYVRAYEKDRSDFNVSKLMYLLGELHARTGDRNEGIRWFGKIVNDKTVSDPRMVQMARDRWTELRTPESHQ